MSTVARCADAISGKARTVINSASSGEEWQIE
jgi:hypothetical protein